VEDVGSFGRLEGAWNELARSVVASHYSQSFEWAKLGWESREADAGDGLICATVWSGERLVGVWPFRRSRRGSASVIEPLGCGLHEEYGDPLIAPDVDQHEVCAALVKLLRSTADILDVHFVRDDSPITGLLAKASMFSMATPFEGYVLERGGAGSFDALLQGFSANFRANLKQKRKRLQKLGELRFELPEDEASCAETLDWVLAEKREWLLRNDKESRWLPKDEARSFFLAAAMKRGDLGRVGFFRLTLDGRPIAAFLSTIDRTRIEMFVTVFAPEYGRFSPGMLIIEDVARWGFERGLDFDMRVLTMDYKIRWANRIGTRFKHRVPMTWNGARLLLPDYLRFSMGRMARSILSEEQRAALRQALKWRPGFLGPRPSAGSIGPVGMAGRQEE
jgi:CelD/BcsL family acetyltransferase involved in cellulose biosynthesis